MVQLSPPLSRRGCIINVWNRLSAEREGEVEAAADANDGSAGGVRSWGRGPMLREERQLPPCFSLTAKRRGEENKKSDFLLSQPRQGGMS